MFLVICNKINHHMKKSFVLLCLSFLLATFLPAQEVRLLSDVNPGPDGSWNQNFRLFDGYGDYAVYFTLFDGKRRFFIIDANNESTNEVLSFDSGWIIDFLHMEDRFFISFREGSTFSLIEFVGDQASIVYQDDDILSLTEHMGDLYFNVDGFTSGIYRYDISAGNIEEVSSWDNSDNIIDMHSFKDELYIIEATFDDRQLRKLNPNGTSEMIKNLGVGSYFYNHSIFSTVDSLFYFMTNREDEIVHFYRSNGTAEGTYILKDDFTALTTSADPDDNRSIIVFEDGFYFSAETADGPGTYAVQNGSDVVRNITINNENIEFPKYFTEHNGELFFKGTYNDDFSSRILKISDDNSADIAFIPTTTFVNFSDGSYMRELGCYLVHSTHASLFGRELWKSNDVEQMTSLVEDIIPGPLDGGISLSTVASNKFIFTINTPEYGRELWLYDPVSVEDSDCDGYIAMDDCNDNDPQINPGQVEVPYNGVDEDCNPQTLDDDLDQDGFDLADDCNDDEFGINPDATEICDEIDNNCNTEVDEGVQLTYYLDSDGDGYGDAAITFMACEPGQLQVDNGDDCDDNNPVINPDADDIPNNGIDEDCDGMDATSGVSDYLASLIKIYPNPADDVLIIDSDLNFDKYEIRNLLGQKITEGYCNSKTINISSIQKGKFFLYLQNGNDKIIQKSFLKI